MHTIWFVSRYGSKQSTILQTPYASIANNDLGLIIEHEQKAYRIGHINYNEAIKREYDNEIARLRKIKKERE